MSLVSLLKPKGPNGFGYGSTAEEVTQNINLTDKTVFITGCNSGLGKETTRVLSLRGAYVIGTARTKNKAEQTAKDLQINKFLPLECELSNPKSIEECVQQIQSQSLKIDILICNAGIMALPRLEKAFGYELQFFTNHIGHFYLVKRLLTSLSEEARIVVVSSSAHFMAPKNGIDFENLKGEKSYDPWIAYGQSKMANVLFAKGLAKRFEGTKKTAFALHPGVIQTNLSRYMHPFFSFTFNIFSPIFFKTIPEGAATQCYVATAPNIAGLSGAYFVDCNPAQPRKDAEDPNLVEKLWQVSEEITQTL